MAQTVIGDTTGTFHYHLRASRTLLLELRENRLHEADRPMLDLLTEVYAYFAITSNLTLHSNLSPDRNIPQDFFLSAEVLASLNRGNYIYGNLFGCAHELFALINPIARSARRFLSKPNDEQHNAQLAAYEKQILEWTPAPPGRKSLMGTRTPPPPASPDPYDLAARIYQQAILIFLYTMFHGANPPTPQLIATVEPRVKQTLGLAGSLGRDTHIQTTLWWPILMACSCLRDPVVRTGVLAVLETLPYTMLIVVRRYEFLIMLWEEMEADEGAYGPWGIEKTMVRRGVVAYCA